MDELRKYFEAKERAISSDSWQSLRELDLSDDTILYIAGEFNNEILYLIKIQRLSPRVLDYLSRIGRHEEKLEIALKYPLKFETYEYLSSLDDTLKIRILSNKKVPEEIAEKILNDPSEYVRREAARWQNRRKK